MKIDDLFQPDVHSASEKLSSETSVVPATDSEDWVSYYKTTHNFYSYWCFKVVYKRRDDIVISEHIDDYLLETVKERIESMLSIYCPLHSDVRVAFQDVDDNVNVAVLSYEFFADFYYNIPGWMKFVAFMYRLKENIKKRNTILSNDDLHEPYSFGFIADKERNGILQSEYNSLYNFFTWGHILDTLIRCDLDEMDSLKYRDDCRKAKFEVPGSALYDVLTIKHPIWETKVLSVDASLKGFLEFYNKVFGDLAYAVLRDIAKQPENTPYITMKWMFRQINRNFKKNGKEPMPDTWLQKLLD